MYRIDTMLHRVATCTHAEFAMGVAHAIAAADNAHTMAVLFHSLRVAPVRLHWFSDGLYVVRAVTGPPALVGSRNPRHRRPATGDVARASARLHRRQ